MDYIRASQGLGKIGFHCASRDTDIFNYVKTHWEEALAIIQTCGGLLLRNFSLRSLSEFNQLAHSIFPSLIEYVNRSTPRTKLGGKIYTTTEYPPHKPIAFHNENAYTTEWPDFLSFFCIVVPQSGGETPLADSRYVLSKIDKKLVDKFNEKKILYKRNYIQGIDLSWQEVFQTYDRNMVTQYCQKHDMQFYWHEHNENNLELTTTQICQATLQHPKTSEMLWFNQAHLFHNSTLEKNDKYVLTTLFEKEFLPRNAYYGDGTEILENEIQHIRQAYESERIMFQWQKGDVLILDNRLMAHAREPFIGDRKVVVAMGKMD